MYQVIQEKKQFFSLRYSAAIRIWHWLTFLFILGSLVTVLFAETLFDEEEHKGPPPGAKQEQVQNAGGEQRLDPSKIDPATRAARQYRHKIWEAHKWIGFGLCFLFLSRLVIEVRKNKEGRLFTRIKRAMHVPVTAKDEKDEKRHYLLSKGGYVFFYVLLLLMSLTGLILAFEHTPFLEGVQRPSREVHETLQYLMYAYILAHLVGVIRADMKRQKGIVSAMINGGE
jgi:cytochrome b561